MAFIAGRYIRSVLYETAAAAPVVLGGSVLVLIAVAVVAAALPARRAADSDPMTVLREC